MAARGAIGVEVRSPPLMSGFETKAAPLIAWMRGAARRDGAALLGAPSFSHARMPPTNEAEGDAKEEGASAKHGGEVKALVSRVKDRRLTKLKLPLGSRSTTLSSSSSASTICRASRSDSISFSYSRFFSRDRRRLGGLSNAARQSAPPQPGRGVRLKGPFAKRRGLRVSEGLMSTTCVWTTAARTHAL